MQGWKVATSKGSAVHEYLKREFPGLDLRPVPDEVTGLRQVSLGEVDAMVVELSRTSYYIEKEKLLNLRVAGEAGLLYRLRFAVRNDWPELQGILDKGLAAVSADEHREINRRWVLVGGRSPWASREFRVVLAAGLGLIIAGAGAFLLWTRTLRRLVRQRTTQLRQELIERQKAEVALQSERSFISRIMETSPVGVTLVNREGAVIFANAQAERLLGLTRDKITQRTYNAAQWRITGPNGGPFPDDKLPFRLVMASRQPVFGVRHAIEWPDGRRVHLSINGAPLLTEGGDIESVVFTLEDITERITEARVKRESEERYRLVFENSPVSIWEEDFSQVKAFFDTLKHQGVTDIEDYFARNPGTVRQCAGLVRIVDVNQAAADLHGAQSKEELLAGLVNTFTPESFVAFRQELVCLWQNGTEMIRDAVVKTLAGEPRQVTVYFSVCPGYEETLAKVVVSLVDVTERKRAEEALRESEEALRIRERLLKESQRVGQIGGWDWDAVKDRIWWSDEYYRIYGFTPGTPPPGYEEHLRAYTPESAARLDAAVKRAMESGEPYELDLELAKPTTTTRWIVARCEVKRDENGAIWGLRGTAQNITERKGMEEELRKLNEDLEQRVRERTAELSAKNEELERMNRLFVGRELKMIELKRRIREMEKQTSGTKN